MDLETPAWNKRKSEVVTSQGQGRRAGPTGGGRCAGHSVVSQHGRTERVDRHRLQHLSCPLRGASGRGNGRGRAVLSRSGRHQGQTRGRTRRGSRTARSPVRARVGGVSAQLGGNERAGARALGDGENLLGGGNVVKSSPAQLAAHVRHLRAKPCRKIDGKEEWTRIVFCLDPVTLHSSQQ